MVRHLLRVHTHKSQVFHGPTRKIHSLEVRSSPSVPPSLITRLLTNVSPQIRQTVFYTPNTLTVSQGDVIEGTLTCAPNTRNNRDLDIKIAYRTTGGDEDEVMYKMCVLPVFELSKIPLRPPLSF